MAYSDFKLSEIIETFGLTVRESSGLFANVWEQECSELLSIILQENVDLAVAISSEKARNEMIISPILLEIRRKLNYQIIVKNRDDKYLSAHPSHSDVLLVIEVADSSLSYDQDIKIPLYAKAGIADYWIFNLFDNYLECYSEPYQDNQGKYGYLNKRIVLAKMAIALPCFPDFSLDLSTVSKWT